MPYVRILRCGLNGHSRLIPNELDDFLQPTEIGNLRINRPIL